MISVVPLFDLPLEQLESYRPERSEPADFDGFWKATLDEARSHAKAPVFAVTDVGLRSLETFDVTFSGAEGHPIKGWLLVPRLRSGALPVVVEYLGYGGGRGFPFNWLTWSAAGYAHFVMDTRGQGSGWLPGDTPDPEAVGAGNPQFPGFMTRGVLSRESYYYRRLFTDGVLAVAAARQHPAVDPKRVVVAGVSQGGGISIAVSALEPSIEAALVDVPFLSYFKRAIEITDANPYVELRRFLSIHRDKSAAVFKTLSYFDAVNFAVRARVPALFSVGLMDEITPPSTVFAAYNHWAGPKSISVWPYSGHDAGELHHTTAKFKFLADRGIVPPISPTDGAERG